MISKIKFCSLSMIATLNVIVFPASKAHAEDWEFLGVVYDIDYDHSTPENEYGETSKLWSPDYTVGSYALTGSATARGGLENNRPKISTSNITWTRVFRQTFLSHSTVGPAYHCDVSMNISGSTQHTLGMTGTGLASSSSQTTSDSISANPPTSYNAAGNIASFPCVKTPVGGNEAIWWVDINIQIDNFASGSGMFMSQFIKGSSSASLYTGSPIRSF